MERRGGRDLHPPGEEAQTLHVMLERLLDAEKRIGLLRRRHGDLASDEVHPELRCAQRLDDAVVELARNARALCTTSASSHSTESTRAVGSRDESGAPRWLRLFLFGDIADKQPGDREIHQLYGEM